LLSNSKSSSSCSLQLLQIKQNLKKAFPLYKKKSIKTVEKKLLLGGYYKQKGQKKSITTVEKKMILAGY
jgi:hypothetical protein